MVRAPWEDAPIIAPAGAQPQADSAEIMRIQGPPRQAPPRTPETVVVDQAQAQAAPFIAPKAEADLASAQYQARTQPEKDRRESARANRTEITGLRNEFNARPEVKRFTISREATRAVQSLAERAKTAKDPAAHIGLIFNYMKTLDPESVVRETEYATAQNAAGVPDKIRNQYNKILSGEFLSPEQIDDFLTNSQRLYLERARGYNEIAAQTHALLRELGVENVRLHAPIAIGRAGQADPILGSFDDMFEPPAQQEAGDIGFSGRTVNNDVVPITPEQQRAWAAFMAGFKPGQLTPEVAATAWQNITGRPMGNADAVVQHFNQTGQWSPDIVYENPTARELATRMGAANEADLFQQGATMGLSDQATGVGNALHNIVSSPFTEQTFDPAGAYYAGRDAQNMRLDEAREGAGWLGTAAEMAGGFASGRVPARFFPEATTLPARIRTGAGVGAGTGAVAGAGYGEDLEGTLGGAAFGAATGGVLGGAIPVAGAGGRQVWNMGRSLLGRDTDEVARRAVAQAVADDGRTMIDVRRGMEDARANGVPAMLADAGENTTGLLAASTRSPGASRTIAARALEDRQAGLADRAAGAVTRDLGPASNPHVVRDEMMGTAQTVAAPIYERAYARPGAGTFAAKVAPLLSRPSMRRALAKAHRIAQEEGRDPTALGFDLNEAGEVVLTRVPSWQTLDYVKRGMDDVIESYRDPTSGRLNLDTEGRAVNNTLRSFLRGFDEANPDYAAARAAWGGPASAVSAMDRGLKSRNMTADDLENVIRDMTPNEREFFALGNRRALVEAIADSGDTANIVNKVIGTGKRRAMLERLHGARGSANWDRFVQTLEAEGRAFRTYRQSRLGSPTAPNLADDAGLSSATQVGALATDMATTGLPIATIVKQVLQTGAGRAGQQAREAISRILTEQDPRRIEELAQQLTREARRMRSQSLASRRRARIHGRAAGLSGSANKEDKKR